MRFCIQVYQKIVFDNNLKSLIRFQSFKNSNNKTEFKKNYFTQRSLSKRISIIETNVYLEFHAAKCIVFNVNQLNQSIYIE